jgi:hypothetical protein
MKLSFNDFALEILKTGDIDPDYIFYKNMRKDFSDNEIFDLIHLKLCVYKTESELLIKYKNYSFSSVKYGNERNKNKHHSFKNYKNLKTVHEKLNLIDFKNKTNGIKYKTFNKFITQIHGIGSWASWKYADILNKVLDFNIKFCSEDFILGYEYPLKGLLLFSGRNENLDHYKDLNKFNDDINKLENSLKNIKGSYKEIFDPTNVSEYETLLCKYHSYYHNHYHPQEDLIKLRKMLNNKELNNFYKYLP